MPIFRRWAKACDNRQRDGFEDRPTNNDLLSFRNFVNPLADMIEKMETPLTVGIYGEWGSGKTSFLRLLGDCLKNKNIDPIWFNAWKYKTDENLWAALIQTIINQAGQRGSFFGKLRVKYRLWRFRTDLGAGASETARVVVSFIARAIIIFACVIAGIQVQQISKAVNAFFTAHALFPISALPTLLAALAIIIGFVALDPTKLWELFFGNIHLDFKKFERELSYRQHIAFYDKFMEEVQQLVDLLRPPCKPLVVIIDDLDRCLREDALRVLESIKVFLDDINGCIFLVAVDKKAVELAIDEKYTKDVVPEGHAHELQHMQHPHPANDGRNFHEDYFDKIIPLAFVVPRLRQEQIGVFIRELNRKPGGSTKTDTEKDKTDTEKDEIAVDKTDPNANVIDPEAKLDKPVVDVLDHHIELCSDIFTGLPPNPRKIKRAVRSFVFVRNQILAHIEEEKKRKKQDIENQEKDMLASLLAKLIVIQSRFPQFYEEIVRDPSLPGELETYYRSTDAQKEAFSSEQKAAAESHKRDYSGLPDILKTKISDADTFVNANVDGYITRIGTLAELRPSPGRRVVMESRGAPGVIRIAPDSGTAEMIAQQERSPAPIFWNVPSRNSLFTAREDILRLLRDEFARRFDAKSTCVALCGLGGIGKTQIAVEYAYRFRDRYRLVLWVNAETRGALLADFAAIAELLRLAEGHRRDQSHRVHAVMSWLGRQSDWLLVLDGITNLDDAQDALRAPGNGHLLLTTRQQISSENILSIDVDPFKSEEGALLLFRRARLIGANSLLADASLPNLRTARKIVQALDGLPLALDQAGAYIEETGCTLAEYLERYRKSSAELLNRRGYGFDHPEPVTATFTISFAKVREESAAAAELLQLCAFLAPDDIPIKMFMPNDIPIEMFIGEARDLGEVLGPEVATGEQLNALIKELEKFSLIRHNGEAQTISMHPLVQTVVKDGMAAQMKGLWAERAILLVYDASEKIELSDRSQYERYLSQVWSCVELVKQFHLESPQAAQVFDRVGRYLNIQFRYAEAEAFLKSALETLRAAPGPAHPDILTYMDNLAVVYLAQRKYDEAASLLKGVLAMREDTLGPGHPDVATTLNTLGGLYNEQGNYAEAEPMLKRALVIRENTLGKEHPDVATTLITLGNLYYNLGRFNEALEPMQRVLEIRKKVMDEKHPEVAKSMSNLAGLFVKLGNTPEAEAYYKQALAIYDATAGPDNPNLLSTLTNYRSLLQQLKREEDVAALDARIKKIQESYVEKNE